MIAFLILILVLLFAGLIVGSLIVAASKVAETKRRDGWLGIAVLLAMIAFIVAMFSLI